uniref:Ras-like protein family member 12 n=1 Tax=Anser brachyrhynchus TaxID=132585 RepID=A0A8B9BVN0_9AVES
MPAMVPPQSAAGHQQAAGCRRGSAGLPPPGRCTKGTVLGAAGDACPARPRRGSLPYKEFGWGPSGGSSARLRLPHSLGARAAKGPLLPQPHRGLHAPGELRPRSHRWEAAFLSFSTGRGWKRGSPSSCSPQGCGWRRAHPLAGWRERPRPCCPAGRWVRVPTSPLLSPAGPRMSSMFGKPRAGAERPPQSPLAECNVAILGCRGAGKSALTVKFLTKRFISEYDPNLEDTYTSEELVDQQPVLLKVMDTADQDGPGNCERYLRWANAFLVVYSIDDRESFEGCRRYLDVLARHARGCQHESPVLLLGNKLDMEQYRQVTKAEGMALASKFGCLFYEVSACQDFAAVQHVFHEAVREVRREAERSVPLRPLFIAEERPCLHVATPATLATRQGLASCTLNTLSTVNYKEIPSVAQAKLVTVKSSRAQSKRKAPTLTLLKGFKIF